MRACPKGCSCSLFLLLDLGIKGKIWGISPSATGLHPASLLSPHLAYIPAPEDDEVEEGAASALALEGCGAGGCPSTDP